MFQVSESSNVTVQEPHPSAVAPGTDSGHSSNVLFEALDWAKDNALDPFVNGLLAPYQGIAQIVDSHAKEQILPEYTPLNVGSAKELSPAWMVQGISGGLGALAPILLASAAIGGVMRSSGEAFGARFEAANILKNPRLSIIAAGGLYEGIRTPDPGESRFSNAVTGVASVAALVYGDQFVKGLPLIPRFATYAGIGGGMGALRIMGSSLINTGKMPSGSDIWHGALDMAALNVLLPPATQGLFDVIDKANVSMGRGVPIDRYVARMPGDPSAGSPALAKLIDDNPWARVQEGATTTHSDAATNRIYLATGDNSADQLGHGLSHLQTAASTQAESGFNDAAHFLKEGNVDQARTAYTNVRASHETQAIDSARTIATDLKITNRIPIDNASDISTRTAIPGETFGQVWDDEFKQFQNTNGAYRPALNY
jgi:hypothetical protein